MLYKTREVTTIIFYGKTLDEAHDRFVEYCKDKHVLDSHMGTAPDGRAFFSAVIEKCLGKCQQLNEG